MLLALEQDALKLWHQEEGRQFLGRQVAGGGGVRKDSLHRGPWSHQLNPEQMFTVESEDVSVCGDGHGWRRIQTEGTRPESLRAGVWVVCRV